MHIVLFATALLLFAVLHLAYKAAVKMIEPKAYLILPQAGSKQAAQDAVVIRYVPSQVHMWSHIAQTTNC